VKCANSIWGEGEHEGEDVDISRNAKYPGEIEASLSTYLFSGVGEVGGG
jgi:hypothetical protein